MKVPLGLYSGIWRSSLPSFLLRSSIEIKDSSGLCKIGVISPRVILPLSAALSTISVFAKLICFDIDLAKSVYCPSVIELSLIADDGSAYGCELIWFTPIKLSAPPPLASLMIGGRSLSLVVLRFDIQSVLTFLNNIHQS